MQTFVLWSPGMWALLSVVGGIGLLAIISPSSFSALTTRSNLWIDTNKLVAALDKRVDVDRYILPFSRALGLAVVLAVAVIAILFSRYLPGG
jgi:hypothetical protein